MGFVVKLVYTDDTIEPLWVRAGSGRGLGMREHATVFPDREAATAEAKIWKAISETTFAVIVEPA
jgi:hypothetical protein